ncbi:MAG: Holliday junction branch migration protein RuvA [Verrucomicrobiota bacterium]
MIAFISGKLVESLPGRIIIETGGLGYEILIPNSTYENLPNEGQDLRLWTHLQVKEDAHTLYGFHKTEQRDLFRLLISYVSGVGPKLALSLLSGCTSPQFRTAVAHGDVGFLSKIKGVGKKTAERIIVELKDKMGVTEAWATSTGTALSASEEVVNPQQELNNDALLALMALGYKQPHALKALEKVTEKTSIEQMVRDALKLLS